MRGPGNAFFGCFTLLEDATQSDFTAHTHGRPPNPKRTCSTSRLWGPLLAIMGRTTAAAAAVISGRFRVGIATQGSMYFPGTYATGNGNTQVTEVGGE